MTRSRLALLQAVHAVALAVAGACRAPDSSVASDVALPTGWPRHHVEVLEHPGRSTPAVDAPFRFDEIVPSWNVRVGEGGGFRARLRVARRDGPWSAWYDVGEWGEPGDDAATSPHVGDEDGRVDVDTFLSAGGHDRAQLEIVPRPADAGVVVERLALCFTRRDAGAPPRPCAPAPLALDVPYRSQRDAPSALAPRVCSPTSLAMVLAYRGLDRPIEEVAARAYDARHDIYGNWPRAVQTAFAYGVPGYVARFSEWDDVERHLRAHGPLVVSIGVQEGQLSGAPYASTPGHLLVVTGFDEHGDVRVNDPAAADAASGRLVYRRAQLERVWLRRGGTAYVFLRR